MDVYREAQRKVVERSTDRGFPEYKRNSTENI